jgi:hypothetical protein
MRTLLSLFLLAIAPAAWCQATPVQQPPFSLTLSALTPIVESGSSVHIKIVMKNLSNHDVDCTPDFRNGLDEAYKFEIGHSSGKPLEDLTKKHPEIGKTFSPVIERFLKPGETTVTSEVVSEFYDMALPGEYTIQASRRVSDNPKDGVVKSNKITITVTLPNSKVPPSPSSQK